MSGLEPLERWEHGFESYSSHGYLSAFSSVELSCLGTGCATCQFPIKRVVPRFLKGFMFSEINSESKDASGTSPCDVQKQQHDTVTDTCCETSKLSN